MEEDEYKGLLAEVGFGEVSILATRFYRAEDAHALLEAAGLDPAEVAPAIDGRFMSAFVRAVKPR